MLKGQLYIKSRNFSLLIWVPPNLSLNFKFLPWFCRAQNGVIKNAYQKGQYFSRCLKFYQDEFYNFSRIALNFTLKFGPSEKHVITMEYGVGIIYGWEFYLDNNFTESNLIVSIF